MNGRNLILLLYVAVMLSSTGCFRMSSRVVEKLANDEKEAIAQAYVQKLKDGQIADLAGELQPQLQIAPDELTAQLTKLRTLIPPETPTQIELVGFNVNYTNGETRNQFIYQYGYGEKWVLFTVTWRELPDHSTQLQGLYLNLLDRPLQETNAFTFRDKALRHYVFVLLLVLIPVFTLTTLIVCIRSRFTGRKWPWVLFILAGFGGLSLNWTTGQMEISILKLSLLGSTVFAAGPYAAWIITISLPLGAICFWFRRRPKPPPPLATTVADS